MDLSGSWRAIAADDDVRRDGIGLDFDDAGWLDVTVPGHWRGEPELATSDGPILYRRRFDGPPPDPGRRRWITFNGIFYQADVWLDGAYLGDPEGYFFPHSFDITALARLGDHHVLAVEVACNDEQGTRGRRNITGLFQHSEAVDRDWNPGGLWRPVLLYDTGPAKLDRLRVLCRDADESRAHVRLYARIDSDAARTVRLRTTADGVTVGETEHSLAAGVNEIEWPLDLDRPQLWWPAPSALSRSPRSASSCSSTAWPAIAGPAAPACARSPGTTGCARSTASACSSRGPTCCPPARAWPTPIPRRCAATSSSPPRPASTCSACRRTSPITSSTAPRTSSASWCCRTSRCSGATPGRSGGRPCARLGRR